jgi:MATE family multidrug resistance protein
MRELALRAVAAGRSRSLFAAQTRAVIVHAVPMLIAQLASMGMMIIDTVLLGHHGTEDLAAVAVGGGVYIAVVFALAGILQAISPTVSHMKGARRDDEIGGALQQCFWLALLLCIPGVAFLCHPDALLGLSKIEPGVEAKARAYLSMLAWGLPAALFYRTFYAFCNALGQPRPLMLISLGCTLLHGLLAWSLVTGFLTGAPLGAVGCGISNALVGWFSLFCAIAYVRYGEPLAHYALFARWQWPRARVLSELLRLGLPMGFSNFVEVSAFTLTSLFVAPLGASVIAGHRIVANIFSIGYMLPLALAIATLTQVGHAVGARDLLRARLSAGVGILLAAALATVFAAVVWIGQQPIVAAYSNDSGVRAVALSLIVFIVAYQVFDAVQTVAAFSLRAYKITFVPMLVHIVCFWGIGLYGGWWLAFRAGQPLGVAGFWIASVASVVAAAVLLGGLLLRAVRREH